MAKSLQKKIMQAIEREPRYHNRVYEKRAIISGVEVYASAADSESCTRKFLDNLLAKLPQIRGDQSEGDAGSKTSKSISFSEFSLHWFEEVHRKKVIPGTYRKDLANFHRHTEPYFGKKLMKEITTGDCILFNSYFREKKIDRTWEACEGILRQILQYAEACEIIPKNPMAALKRVKADRENGVPLTKKEERAFLQAIKGSKYEPVFVLALYTGLRPCEISSARVEEPFIVARNRKQKNVKKIVFKKIPITPMLEPYRAKLLVAASDWPELTRSEAYMNEVFKTYCAGHVLSDLRTTFSTRTQECGVPDYIVDIWMGHSPKSLLGKVYTKFSDEYLLKEGEKVKY